jgi:hypothetical protein
MLVISTLGGPFLSRGLPKGVHIVFLSPDRDVAKQPKWLPQTLTALQTSVTKGNKAAQEFIAFTDAEAKKRNTVPTKE